MGTGGIFHVTHDWEKHLYVFKFQQFCESTVGNKWAFVQISVWTFSSKTSGGSNNDDVSKLTKT